MAAAAPIAPWNAGWLIRSPQVSYLNLPHREKTQAWLLKNLDEKCPWSHGIEEQSCHKQMNSVSLRIRHHWILGYSMFCKNLGPVWEISLLNVPIAYWMDGNLSWINQLLGKQWEKDICGLAFLLLFSRLKDNLSLPLEKSVPPIFPSLISGWRNSTISSTTELPADHLKQLKLAPWNPKACGRTKKGPKKHAKVAMLRKIPHPQRCSFCFQAMNQQVAGP